jgi:hypothetical protein
MTVASRTIGEVHHANRSPLFQCGACEAVFDGPAWRSLDLAERIEACAAGRLVRGWPANECGEVRVCRGCGKMVAARTTLVASEAEQPARCLAEQQGLTPGVHPGYKRLGRSSDTKEEGTAVAKRRGA